METLKGKPYFKELQQAVDAVQLASTLCQVLVTALIPARHLPMVDPIVILAPPQRFGESGALDCA